MEIYIFLSCHFWVIAQFLTRFTVVPNFEIQIMFIVSFKRIAMNLYLLVCMCEYNILYIRILYNLYTCEKNKAERTKKKMN